jgi:hypothetical protein
MPEEVTEPTTKQPAGVWRYFPQKKVRHTLPMWQFSRRDPNHYLVLGHVEFSLLGGWVTRWGKDEFQSISLDECKAWVECRVASYIAAAYSDLANASKP